MALETKSPDNDLSPGRDPAEDEFNQLIDKNFSPGDRRMMEERARKGADEDKSLADREASGGEDGDQGFSGHNQHENQVGRGYKPDNPEKLLGLKPSVKGVFNFARSNRGRLVLGGGAVGIATMLVIGFFILIPFKILNIVNNLQSHFAAAGENAVQQETDVLFSSYVKKYVLPGLTSCSHSTIDKNCNPKSIVGTSPVSRLYKGWKTARLENKLADNYGIEFQKKGGNYYLKTSDMTGNGANLGTDKSGFAVSNETLDNFIADSNDPEFKKVSRAELRQAYKDALKNETKWDKVMYRFKIASLLQEKYGVKHCITDIGCKVSDKISDSIAAPKKAAQVYIAERVLFPRSQILGTVFNCLFLDPNCKPQDVTPNTCTEGVDCASNGAPESDTDKEVRTKLDSMIASFAGEDAYKIYEDISKSGSITQYMVKTVVANVWSESAGQTAADKIPVIGWINLASQIVQKGKNIGPETKKLAYVTNAVSMVQLWSTYRTYADEIKSGHVDPTEVGSFTDSLGPSTTADKGGTASAEQSPLYQMIVEGKSLADSHSNTYKCDNGKAPTGPICSEESLNSGNSIAESVSAFFKLPGVDVLTAASDVWNNSAGAILKLIGNVGQYLLGKTVTGPIAFGLSLIPGYNDIKNEVIDVANKGMQDAVSYLIPNPFSDNMSGGRTFDLMAGGADVSLNDYAHNGLGGQVLSNSQVAAIRSEQENQDLQEYKSKPVLARLFDTSSKYSLSSKIAMAMPDNWTSAQQTIASIFSNPFGKLSHSFASLFSFNQAFAAATPSDDPFGVTQYGYPTNDPIFTTDPEAYWDQHCADNPVVSNGAQTTAWNNDAAQHLNPDTDMPENTTTNPCLLLQATVGSDGAVYDSSLLTADDSQQ